MEGILAELSAAMTGAWWKANWVALVNIIMIDLVLAGDNAIIVGLAASRVAPELRAKVIFWGITGAVVLRIMFAAVTNQLLQIVGLTLAGGLLLLWVCWKMYRQITEGAHDPDEVAAKVDANLNEIMPRAAILGEDGSGIVGFKAPTAATGKGDMLSVNREGKGNLPPLNVRMSQAVTPSNSDGSTE